MATRAAAPPAPQTRARPGRSGLLIALLALGGSLLILTPLSLLAVRRDVRALHEGPTLSVEVVADGMRFVPREIRVPPGATVRVDLVNQDPSGTPHDFQTFGQRRDTRVIAWPGERRATSFTAPSRPGRYAFICTIRGHSALGMSGVIVVGDRE